MSAIERLAIFCVLLAGTLLLSRTGVATAEVSASLCDVWPLAAGNEWYCESNFGTSEIQTFRLRIVEDLNINGFGVYKTIANAGGGMIGQGPDQVFYLVFVNGWLMGTPNAADLDALPEVSSGMRKVLPETLTPGEEYDSWLAGLCAGVDTPQPFMTLGASTDHALIIQTGPEFGVLQLNRGVGPVGIGGSALPGYHAIIVGGCGGQFDVSVEGLDTWYEAGATLKLGLRDLGAKSALTFQWLRNDVPIPGQTDSECVIEGVTEADAGRYRCTITEASKAFHTTDSVQVAIVAEGALPVAGLLGTSLLAAAILALGLRNTRRPALR